ncbi:hypothetical protein HRED_06013 [Candidatus Haloredivivus sp. G17]|nr:hypothetical protein HRED_06013 [Candidatus Haloredivivus sp. G17]
MSITLVGGNHPDSAGKWKEKVPDRDYDIVATEMVSSYDMSRKLARGLFQPFSTLTLALLDSFRVICHNLLGLNYRQNDNKIAVELAEEYDAELLKIDASAPKQMESFELKNEKTLIDWFNVLVLYQLFTNFSFSLLDASYLIMLNVTIQLVATLWMYKNFRDQFMTKKILNQDDESELIALTGALHTPAIAGYLYSKGNIDLEMYGAPELK